MQTTKHAAHVEMKANGISPVFWRESPVKGGWFRNPGIEPIQGDTVTNENGRIGLFCGRGPGGTLWIAWDRTLKLADNHKLMGPRTESDYRIMTTRLAALA